MGPILRHHGRKPVKKGRESGDESEECYASPGSPPSPFRARLADCLSKELEYRLDQGPRSRLTGARSDVPQGDCDKAS